MLLRHVLAILTLPALVTIAIPAWIVSRGEAWRLGAAPRVLLLGGALLLGATGLALVVRTVHMFVRIGRGTLAPWDPTRRLVVHGVYRHVRNPMISGVFLVLVAEALAFRSTGLLLWAAAFFGINAVYMPLVEEPGLARRFGEDYERYRSNVPRWIPRRTPWSGE